MLNGSAFHMIVRVTLAPALALWLCAGCATSPPQPPAGPLGEATAPVWSLKHAPNEFVVAVSPVRQTLQIGGTYGALLGAGIDVFRNEPYRRAFRELTQDYDPGEVFEARLTAAVQGAITPAPQEVAPLGSWGRHASARDAQLARLGRLSKDGAEAVLDLKISYGVFGPSGLLVAKIDGILYEAPAGRTLWRNHIVASWEPVLATEILEDPTHRLFANYTSPGFKVKDDAIVEWTQDAGETFRSQYEQTVDAAVEALLCDLGLRENPVGYYHLGKSALMHKRFDTAEDYFRKALALDESHQAARNGLAVSLAYNKEIEEALATIEELVWEDPAFGPGWHNLAWLHAVKNKDPVAAAEPYRKARELGMPRSRKIERRLK